MIQTHPTDSTDPRKKIGEIAALLAAALLRLQDRKSSRLSQCHEENPLDCEAVIDGHVRQTGKELPHEK